MQSLTFLQEWIHKLESAKGLRYLKWLVFVLGALALLIRYDLHAARNMAAPSAMDAAQLGRNIAMGRGYTTDCLRPLSLFLIKEKKLSNDPDPARLNRNHPDISNPPVYPVVLAGLMKVLPFHYDTSLKGKFWSRPDPKAPNGRRGMRYQPDFLITFFNQVLFFIVVALAFLWAWRLYDLSVARTSAVVLLLSEELWHFSASGLSTMLLLLIFMGLIWCLTLWESEIREPKWGYKGAILLSAAVGLLMGIGALTRYSFLSVILPVMVFLVVFGGPRRWLYFIPALLVAALVMTPWIVRNYELSGKAFGTASYNIIESFSPGFRLQRSLQPELPGYGVSWYFRKLLENLGPVLQGDFIRDAGGWISALFLVGLLVGFRSPALRRMRYFLVGSMVTLVIAQALGMTNLSEETPNFNSENLLVLVSPPVAIYGVGLFYSLLENIRFPIFQLRYVTVGWFIFLIRLPIWFALFLPAPQPLVYPPYWPEKIQQISQMLEPDELMMTDIPWAVAWYGDREAVWLTLNAAATPDKPTDWHESFFAINNRLKPIHMLYLTPRSLDARLQSDLLRSGDFSWDNFILGLVSTKRIPEGFPLMKAPPGYWPEQLVLSDVVR